MSLPHYTLYPPLALKRDATFDILGFGAGTTPAAAGSESPQASGEAELPPPLPSTVRLFVGRLTARVTLSILRGMALCVCVEGGIIFASQNNDDCCCERA
jgi:hypothetical protein